MKHHSRNYHGTRPNGWPVAGRAAVRFHSGPNRHRAELRAKRITLALICMLILSLWALYRSMTAPAAPDRDSAPTPAPVLFRGETPPLRAVPVQPITA